MPALSQAAFIEVEPRSVAQIVLSPPSIPPMGVRTPARITIGDN